MGSVHWLCAPGVAVCGRENPGAFTCNPNAVSCADCIDEMGPATRRAWLRANNTGRERAALPAERQAVSSASPADTREGR